MKTLTLSESFKTLIERNKNRSKICKALSIAERLPMSIHCQTIDYLTTRPNGIISFLPNGRELKYNNDGQWSREGRNETRAGRILQQIFSESLLNSFNQTDIEVFSNIVSGYESDLNYTIIKGWDIVNLYDERSPIEVIENSCMQNVTYWEDSEGEEFSRVELYALNPDKVECLVFRDEQGRLIGRALKWLTDCGVYMVDRTYAKETIREQIHNICAVNGWYKKEHDTYQQKDKFIYQGERITKEFKITLKNVGTTIPYLDCFTYGNNTDKGLELTNIQPAYIPHLIATNTDGQWSNNGQPFVYCPIKKYQGRQDEFAPSDFYGGRLVYKCECYPTNKGRIYGTDMVSDYYLKYKGEFYQHYSSTTIAKGIVAKGKIFKRTDVNWLNGYEIYLDNGKPILVVADDCEEVRKSFGIVRDEQGREIERIEVIRLH